MLFNLSGRVYQERCNLERLLARLECQVNAADYQRRKQMLLMIFYQNSVANRMDMSFRDFLSAEGAQRRLRSLPRVALVDPNASPWQKIYNSGNDQAFIVTDFDTDAFHVLLAKFEPLFTSHIPWTGLQDGCTYARVKQRASPRGRPRKVSASQCLGLVLSWYRFKGPEYTMQGWFGFTGTHVNVWLRFGGRMLFRALWTDDRTKVRMPELMSIVQAMHNKLKNVYCVADGFKLMFEACDGLDEQSML